MHPPYRPVPVHAILSTFLVFGLAACSDASNPSEDMEYTTAFTAELAAAQTDEVDETVEALELESTPPGFVVGTPSHAIAPRVRPRRAACATVVNTTDSDSDGTPDQATFTFAVPACHFTNFRGGTLDITGVVVLSDPTPESADMTAHLDLDDFRLEHTNPDQTRSYATTRNGTRALTASASSATVTNTITTVRSVTGRADATISHNTSLVFTPDEHETLQRGEPLPNGTFELSGMLTWSRQGRSRAFTVTTVVPLRRDASCATDRKIAEGEIHWTLSNGNYIKTVWSGCGEEPVRTFVRAS